MARRNTARLSGIIALSPPSQMCLQLLPDGADCLALHERVQDHAGHLRAVDDLAGVAAPGAILTLCRPFSYPCRDKRGKSRGSSPAPGSGREISRNSVSALERSLQGCYQPLVLATASHCYSDVALAQAKGLAVSHQHALGHGSFGQDIGGKAGGLDIHQDEVDPAGQGLQAQPLQGRLQPVQLLFYDKADCAPNAPRSPADMWQRLRRASLWTREFLPDSRSRPAWHWLPQNPGAGPARQRTWSATS